MSFESTSEFEKQDAPAERSPTRWTLLFAFGVFAGVAFLVIYSLRSGGGGQMGADHPAVGRPLSVLKLEPFLDAEQAIDRAMLEGRVTLINYWGPWCLPCRIEMPHLAEIVEDYRQNDEFQFFSVACGSWAYESAAEMRFATAAFRDEQQLKFPIYYDPEFGSRSGLEADLGIEPRSTAYPTTVLIDRQGNIAGLWRGFSDEVPPEISAALARQLGRN